MTTPYPHAYPPPPPQPRPSSGRPVLGTLLLLVIAALAGFWIARWWNRGTPDVQSRAVTPRGDLADIEKTAIQIFKQTNPSVVFITTRAETYDLRMRGEVLQGTGSGFIWDDAGDIVTNFHVVKDATSAQVTMWDHKAYPADLVGVAPDNDLAVVRIHAPKDRLKPILIGDSGSLQVGQMSFAIGDPFGLDQTLTQGIISALGRTITSVANTPIDEVIQTQAPINPGNSGGPLLDSAGRLIGVNTAILSPSGTSAGIGFAIPVDQVNRIVPQLIANGKITRPKLGITLSEPISQELTRRVGVQGVLILGVQPNSPAAAAGLRGTQRLANGTIALGDIIQKVDGKPVKTSNDLFHQIEKHNPGDTVKLTLWRDGNTLDVDVKLGEPGAGGEE